MIGGSQVLIIASNRFKLMIRNRLFVLLCIVLPVIFSLMVNRIFEKSNLYDSIPIALIDKDGSKLTETVIEKLKHNNSIGLEFISEKDIEDYISKEKVQAVYIFEEGMEARIEKGKYEGIVSVYTVPGSITAMGISDIIAGEIVPYICGAKVVNGAAALLKDADRTEIKNSIYKGIEALVGDPDLTLPVLVDMRTPEKGEIEEKSQKGDVFSLQIGLGMIIIFSTIFMLTGCSAIIKERENRIRDRIKSSGVAIYKLLMADIAAVTFAGLIITLLQFIMMHKVLAQATSMEIITVFIISFVYILCAASMLILLSAIFSNHISFQSFMPVVILLMGILSGCIWSLELMPETINRISAFIPSYWAHSALSEVILFGGGLGTVHYSLEIMLFITGIFVISSYLIYKRK